MSARSSRDIDCTRKPRLPIALTRPRAARRNRPRAEASPRRCNGPRTTSTGILVSFRDRPSCGLTVRIGDRRSLTDRRSERLDDTGMVLGELARGGVKDDRIMAGQISCVGQGSIEGEAGDLSSGRRRQDRRGGCNAGRVFDLAAAAQRADVDASFFRSMLSLIDADEAGLDAARALAEKRGVESELWTDLATARLLAPLPEPRQMRDAMSFERISASRGAERAPWRRARRAARRRSAPRWRRRSANWRRSTGRCRSITSPTGSGRRTGNDGAWPRYSEVMDYELEVGS